mmetsp:Transcript_16095/g.32602  ORF Transcript_16095/g.32602 Transcript_16095/m.32602 type:complete len:150 (+) Transcript_16095:230-679(+)
MDERKRGKKARGKKYGVKETGGASKADNQPDELKKRREREREGRKDRFLTATARLVHLKISYRNLKRKKNRLLTRLHTHMHTHTHTHGHSSDEIGEERGKKTERNLRDRGEKSVRVTPQAFMHMKQRRPEKQRRFMCEKKEGRRYFANV